MKNAQKYILYEMHIFQNMFYLKLCEIKAKL